MPVVYQFASVEDWSRVERGLALVDLLAAFGLEISKAAECEPIRRTFHRSLLADQWVGGGLLGGTVTCNFLFKGDRSRRFQGEVEWSIDMLPHRTDFNTVWLRLSESPKVTDQHLVALGDALFEWANAVFGFIHFERRGELPKPVSGIINSLPGLSWVNYFGVPYLRQEGFRLPEGAQGVAHGGIRFMATPTADDPRLQDEDYLATLERNIGPEWFGADPEFRNRAPTFDFSALRR